MDHSSSTTFYPSITADDILRKKIESEMLAGGYRKRTTSDGISYTKSYGFLSLYHGYVHIRNDGKVIVGAGHDKWPRLTK